MGYRIVSSLVGLLFAQMFFFAAHAIAFSNDDLARLNLIGSCPYCDLTYAQLPEANLSDTNLTGGRPQPCGPFQGKPGQCGLERGNPP